MIWTYVCDTENLNVNVFVVAFLHDFNRALTGSLPFLRYTERLVLTFDTERLPERLLSSNPQFIRLNPQTLVGLAKQSTADRSAKRWWANVFDQSVALRIIRWVSCRQVYK